MELNCIQCKAPLMLMGNSLRNRYLACQYCGTVMDARENFKALYSFQITQEDTIIRIGKKFTFQDVVFEVVGFISYQANAKQWLDYQLYSNTHGYAKLIYRKEEVFFIRKTHYLPQPNIWMQKEQDKFILQKKEFVITAFDFSEIYYAAGNFTEAIKPGKRNKQCFARSGRFMFHSVFNSKQVNNYFGQALNPELFRK